MTCASRSRIVIADKKMFECVFMLSLEVSLIALTSLNSHSCCMEHCDSQYLHALQSTVQLYHKVSLTSSQPCAGFCLKMKPLRRILKEGCMRVLPTVNYNYINLLKIIRCHGLCAFSIFEEQLECAQHKM